MKVRCICNREENDYDFLVGMCGTVVRPDNSSKRYIVNFGKQIEKKIAVKHPTMGINCLSMRSDEIEIYDVLLDRVKQLKMYE